VRFKDRVGVWQKTASSDGFGGNTVSETQLGSSWAKVNSISRDKYQDYGLNTASQAIELYLRHRSDIDYFAQDVFFKYKGKSWFPISIEDNGLESELIRILADGER
jgi:head-tail adaptor